MIGYISVGADDLARAERFYSAFLPGLGWRLEVSEEGLSYIPPVPEGQAVVPPDFYVKPPFNGEPASSGNGTMVAFEVPTQALLRDLHAAAVAAGGTDEGAPGFRAAYSASFYVGYLRDPQGNKIALYCSSPGEPVRPD